MIRWGEDWKIVNRRDLVELVGKNARLVDGNLEKRGKRERKKNDCEAVIFYAMK